MSIKSYQNNVKQIVKRKNSTRHYLNKILNHPEAKWNNTDLVIKPCQKQNIIMSIITVVVLNVTVTLKET